MDSSPVSKNRQLLFSPKSPAELSIEHGMKDSPENVSRDTGNNSLSNEEPLSSNSDGDDAMPIKRRKPGLAARLIRQAETDESEPEPEVDGKTAYQLMRERLLGKRQNRQEEQVQEDGRNSFEHRDNYKSPMIKNHASRSPSRSSDAAAGPAPHQKSPAMSLDMGLKSHTSLFLSPESSPEHGSRPSEQLDGSSSERNNPRIQSRLQELVAKKRAERLAKEEGQRRATKDAHEESVSPTSIPNKTKSRRIRVVAAAETDSDEGGSGRKLTEGARPTRKASKKAVEEMNRETQRISRNQQLAHSVLVKKKIRKEDLFARFNFRTSNAVIQGTDQSATTGDSSASALGSAPASSDVDMSKETETPPSSPPAVPGSNLKSSNPDNSATGPEKDNSHLIQEDSDDSLPLPGEMLLQSRPKVDKGKAPVRGDISFDRPVKPQPPEPGRQPRSFRVIPPSVSKKVSGGNFESDDDLAIIDDRLSVFDKVPTRKRTELHAMQTLRALAHLKSPGKTRSKGKSSMTPTELQALLSKRARDQARKERDERIDELRAKGVYIPTEEEKQKEQLLVENLLEKARQEAQELSKKEKDAAKTDGEDGGDGLPSSDEEYEDEDSEASREDVEERAIELSGSEDESNEEAGGELDDADDEEDNITNRDGLLDNEAGDSEEGESTQEGTEKTFDHQDSASDEFSKNDLLVTSIPARMRARNNRVVKDDDDEDTQTQENDHPTDQILAIPGLDTDTPASLSMTQMFAATMDAGQSQSQQPRTSNTEQDSIAFLRQLPSPTVPGFDTAMAQFTQNSVVPNSQAETPQKFSRENQRGPTPATGKTTKYTATQYSDVPDPTQDFGFELSRSPERSEAMPHSTVDTVALTQPSQLKKWGRLRRKAKVDPDFSDVDENAVEQYRQTNDDDEFEISANAFDVMRTASKSIPLQSFDKKKSGAKDMFEEQAEESEDEYAGLGGASDDESGGENEEDRKMIDESDVKLNERELAAFFADKERIRDEKEVEKLYRDIANGGLRRKRGADFELSDSDDDVEARRRRKQREFARQRKALLQDDENLGKIAENPKKAAFLRAIEDHDSENEVGLFEVPETDVPVPDSQVSNEAAPDKSSNTQVPASDDTNLKRKKRDEEKFVRPPAQLRRTDQGKKPSNLAEVRETLSFLIDDQQSVPETPISESEPECTASDDEELSKSTSRTEEEPVFTRPSQKVVKPAPLESRRSSGNPIIDRLSLKRSSSSTLSDAENSVGLAFHAPTKNNTPGFKVPSLLRRAATSASAVSAHSDSAKSRSWSVSDEVVAGGVRRGGSKKSSISYAAREAERRSVTEEADRRRREGVKKVAGMRRGVLKGLGGTSAGFE